MANETDLVNLYSGRILALAADIPHVGRLADATATARRRSPQCGSTVTVDLKISDGRIEDIGLDVKACALGQAAASVFGKNAIGATRQDVEAARDALQAMLASGGPAPDAPFEDLGVLVPARDFLNRHASIMLAFDAASDAMAQAERAA